jgi:hypothetical protein
MDPMLLLVIVFPVAIVGFIAIVIIDQKVNKNKYAELMKKRDEEIDKEFERDAEVVSMHAEIVDMICGTGMVGSYHLPKSEKTFLVVFKSDSGEIFEVSVPESYYIELSVGQSGMLTLLEGHLDSFVLD